MVILPQNQKLQTLKMQVEKKQQDYAITQTMSSPQARHEKLESLVVAQDQLDAYVTVQESIGNLTLDIARLATQNKLQLFSSKESTGQAFKEIPFCTAIGHSNIEISFKSKFNQFATFLNQLERHSPAIMIDRFQITRSTQLAGSGHDVKMSLVVLVAQKNLRQPLDKMLKSAQETRKALLDEAETSIANRKAVTQQWEPSL